MASKAMGWGGWGKGDEKGGGKSWSPWQPMPLGRCQRLTMEILGFGCFRMLSDGFGWFSVNVKEVWGS